MGSGRKAPHWIGMKDRAPFALAGLWKELADPKTGELQDRFLVLTCPPNELAAELHNRMPVIIAWRTMTAGFRPRSLQSICCGPIPRRK